MKLKEALKALTTEQILDGVSFDWFAEDAWSEFGIHLNDYIPETQEDRLTTIPLQAWTCTDTCVGTYAIALDGIIVGIYFQSARKSDKVYYWFENTIDSMRTFLRECVEEEPPYNKLGPLALDTELRGYMTDL